MMMRKFLPVLACLSLLLPCGAAEKVIAKYSDVTLETNLKSKWSTTTKSFYVFGKNAVKYRGKKVVFRMDVKRTQGEAALSAGFRCSVKSQGLKATSSHKFDYKENGSVVPVEAVVEVPDIDNISQFNMQVGFRKKGKAITIWEMKNIRFCEFDEAAAKKLAAQKAKEAKSALPEGFAAEHAALTADKPLTLVKDGKLLFTVVIPDEADNIAKFAAKEIADHVKLAVGSAPKIISESQYKSGPALFIGNTKIAQKYGIDPAMLIPEYAIVARAGDVILLSGGDAKDVPLASVKQRSNVAVGTYFAACEFLEHVLGIRWYWPGKYGTHIPQVKDLSVTKLYRTAQPKYDTRTFFYSRIKDPDVKAAEGSL